MLVRGSSPAVVVGLVFESGWFSLVFKFGWCDLPCGKPWTLLATPASTHSYIIRRKDKDCVPCKIGLNVSAKIV